MVGGSLRKAWTPLGGAEQGSLTSRGTSEGGSAVSRRAEGLVLQQRASPVTSTQVGRKKEAGWRAEREERGEGSISCGAIGGIMSRGEVSLVFLECDF